jgi:plasmid stabilization system protein ParE
MAYALIWSAAALADLDEIETYIAVQSPLNARRVVERMWETARKQCDFPNSARMIPEFGDPTRRETFVHQWRLMFRVEADHIRIMRVVHGRRLLKNVPGSFEETTQEPYRAA